MASLINSGEPFSTNRQSDKARPQAGRWQRLRRPWGCPLWAKIGAVAPGLFPGPGLCSWCDRCPWGPGAERGFRLRRITLWCWGGCAAPGVRDVQHKCWLGGDGAGNVEDRQGDGAGDVGGDRQGLWGSFGGSELVTAAPPAQGLGEQSSQRGSHLSSRRSHQLRGCCCSHGCSRPARVQV